MSANECDLDDYEWEDYEDDAGDEWCDHCGNLGVIDCFCGGDICVCRNRGEIECPHCQ